MKRNGLLVILLCVAGLTAAADYLFWWHTPGLSFAIFTVLVAAVLGFVQDAGHKPWRTWILLGGACVATVFEISFSNVMVVLTLGIHLVGENYAGVLNGIWARWCEAFRAVWKAPFRWWWLAGECSKRAFGSSGTVMATTWHGFTIAVPLILVMVLFGAVLGTGNAIYGHWMNEVLSDFLRWLWEDISVARVFFWAAMATLLLALLKPSEAKTDRRRIIDWGCFGPPLNVTVAQWRSLIVLVAVNALYLGANGIDVVYLWSGLKLPDGVSYSQYVHEGVYNLIASTLLAGLLIVLIHQQDDTVVTGWIKALSLFWMAQNALLIAGVLQRLQLYVETYGLSLLRINVSLFLLLVTSGFVFLAVYVLGRKTFGWLLIHCVAATFALFYVVQFCDTSQWVAAYNVAAWKRNPERELDFNYLYTLGPAAWPYLCETGRDPRSFYWNKKDWRSWQLNEWLVRRRIEKMDMRGRNEP